MRCPIDTAGTSLRRAPHSTAGPESQAHSNSFPCRPDPKMVAGFVSMDVSTAWQGQLVFPKWNSTISVVQSSPGLVGKNQKNPWKHGTRRDDSATGAWTEEAEKTKCHRW